MSCKEGILINKTIELLKRQLKNPELTTLEKKAKEFYIEELSIMIPCPDEEIFKKPCANIRSRTVPGRSDRPGGFSKIYPPFARRAADDRCKRKNPDATLLFQRF